MPNVEPTRVAILGGGKGGTLLLDLLSQVPGVELIGVADTNPAAPGIRRALDLNLRVTDNVVDLIAEQGLNLIVDVTGDPAMPALINQHKPPGAEILGGAGAKLVWNMVQHESTLQGQLFQAEKLAGIGSFAAGIAHDINNPLYLVLGFAEAIIEEHDPTNIRDLAQEIIQAVSRISTISREFTQYARQSISSEYVDVELNVKLEEAFKIAQYATVLQDLSVVKDYTGKQLIKAKPDELLHALVNLITNAIQAMDGKGTLTLATCDEDEVATVTISDTGCGIPDGRLEQIFEPFFTTKAPGKGTGLGLYNVKSIVGKNHGKISVTSEVGKGTMFRLQFPLEGQPS